MPSKDFAPLREGLQDEHEGWHHPPQHDAYLSEVASRATVRVSKTRAPSIFVRVSAIGESAQPLNIPISDPMFQLVAVPEVAHENPSPRRSRIFSECLSWAEYRSSLTSC
jgi:hypothetical protein